jgi:hypothetical protein
MKATITYRLTEAGRKASILAGGNGLEEHTIEVPADSPEFAAVVQAGDVDASGNVAWHPGRYDSASRFDACAVPRHRAGQRDSFGRWQDHWRQAPDGVR